MIVGRNLLERVAAWAQPETQRSNGGATSAREFDIQAFMGRAGTQLGLEISGPHSTFDGQEWRFSGGCPFQPDYSDGHAAVLQRINGQLGFHCLRRPSDRKLESDLRELIEDRRNSGAERRRPMPRTWARCPQGTAARVQQRFPRYGSARCKSVRGRIDEPMAAASPGDPVLEPQHADLLNGYDPEDLGNAQRFIAMWRPVVRWCPEYQPWFVWDGRRWRHDESDQVRSLKTMTEFGVQALRSNSEGLLKFAAGCRRSARISNALREAQPHLTVWASELDTDPWLLNFKNGTVDLRTGKLMLTIRGITSRK